MKQLVAKAIISCCEAGVLQKKEGEINELAETKSLTD